MGANALAQVLRQLPEARDKDLLVGFKSYDDAGVYSIQGNKAVVTTLDFFPPIVDDPYLYGQIAAANALSDVYAMGADPRFAMNIVCFPERLGVEVLCAIIKGSVDKLEEAGAFLIGGHSIRDKEVKYGLSVVGFVDPADLTRNSTAKPGDYLVLTKPIGVGVITTALKGGRLREKDAKEAFSSMKALNRGAAEAMRGAGVNACTDITGYGLLGHAMELAEASNVNLVINSKDIEFFSAARRLVKNTLNRPGAIDSNMKYLKRSVELSPEVDEPLGLLMYDPQTSGGLLISVPEDRLEGLVNRLIQRRVKASIIGRAVHRGGARWRIRVV